MLAILEFQRRRALQRRETKEMESKCSPWSTCSIINPLLVLEANKLKDSEPQDLDTNKKWQKAGTLDENVKRTLTNHKTLNVNAELTALNDPKNTE